MRPSELSKIIGVGSSTIRKYARSQFGKADGSWDFTEDQVLNIKEYFGTQSSTVAAPPPAASTIASWKTAAGLTEIARNWLKETYNMELTIPIQLNGRLKKSLGRFRHYRAQRSPINIEIGEDTIKYYGKEVTIDTLKHELIHYACYMQNQPANDGDWYFENELKKHGVTATGIQPRKGELHQYTCSDCHKIVDQRHRQIKPNQIHRYHSKCCHAPLNYEGKVLV